MRTSAITFLLLLIPVMSVRAGEPPALVLEAREHDEVHVRGLDTPQIGTIEQEDDNQIQFRTLRGIRHVWPKNRVTSILRKCTLQEAYQKARQMAGDDPAARLQLYHACLAAGLKEEALSEAKAAVRLGPKYLPAYQALLTVARARNNLDLELGTLMAASKADIATVPMLLRKAQIHINLGIIQSARQPLEQALALEPANSEARGRLAMIEWMAERPEAAAVHVDAMLRNDAADPNALTVRGLIELHRGDPAKAFAAFSKAAAKATSPFAATAAGALALQQGQPRDARKLYAQALALQPDSAPALAGQGLLAVEANEHKKAKSLTARAASQEPNRAGIQLVRAFAAEKSGDHNLALKAYLAVLKIDPPNLNALCGAGRCSLAKNNLRAAQGYFDRALSLRAEWIPALRGQGHVLVNSDPGAAIGPLQRVARSAEATPDDHVALAIALMHLQRFAEASEALAQAGSKNVHARIAQGFLAHSQSRETEAKTHFEAAVALGDSQRYAANALNRIREAEERLAWRDNFERPDSPEVRNGWIEVQPAGVTIAIAQNAVLMDGTPHTDGQTAKLMRPEDAKFVSISAKAAPVENSEAYFGVFVGRRGAEKVLFGRQSDGQLTVQVPGSPPRGLGRRVPAGPFTLRVEMVDIHTGRVRLALNDRAVGRRGIFVAQALAGANELEVGLFAVADKDRKIHCQFLEVEIVRSK